MAFVLLVVTLAGCGRGDEHGEAVRLSGATMATTWNVTYVEPVTAPVPEDIHAGIQAALDAVNTSMSTYLPDSEISRFNNDQPLHEPFAVSRSFAAVIKAALLVGAATNGAYDITVGPLVDLWGFGATDNVIEPPTGAAIAAARERVGQHALRLEDSGQLVKRTPVALDVSSLAKGYAVDAVAEWLAAQGLVDYLVEVGGEMRLAGHSPRGGPWRVAIEQPSAGLRTVAGAILLSDVAVATSGDYRNFFEADGKRYSHMIDPRTGYP
ncbi:MAG: FAD:protein FMN transferase, partial [Halioglobus sp.]|nr:FAD:protein FMN transferase [Halioglobus sp.]